jgi:fimbrial chaperone protein
MRLTVTKTALTAALALAACYPAEAGTLQVAPVLVDVTAPGAASTVTLRNEGTTPINAQIRVFRWSLVNGQEKLEPTDDVVASPPSVTLTPKGQYIARIVRVSKQPVVGEESYRLMVDQLPDLSQQKSGAVNLLMRYSIPVFCGAPTKKNPTVAWSPPKGDKVIRISTTAAIAGYASPALALGREWTKRFFGTGLAGYALGRRRRPDRLRRGLRPADRPRSPAKVTADRSRRRHDRHR